MQKILLYCTCFLLLGCTKMLDVDPPVNSLVKDNVYYSDASVAAVMTGLYSNLNSSIAINSTNLTRWSMLSDEFTNYVPTDEVYVRYHTNELLSVTSSTDWTNLYSGIYVTNVAIEGIEGSSTLSNAMRNQMLGEAKFIRAYLYFYLVNFYGDVPLLTTSNYKANLTVSRTKGAVVYEQIVADLLEAQKLLNDNFLNPDLTVTTERVRPSKWAAISMLARVYLYLGRYQEAEAAATAIISRPDLFSLETDLNKVFLKESREAIWQLMPVVPGRNTNEGNQFILTTAIGGSRPGALSDTLYKSFEPGDSRKDNWTKQVTVRGKVYAIPFKYKVRTATDLTEYSIQLRLAEQFLIRAEARVLQNKMQEGIADVNEIRKRARGSNGSVLPDVPATATTTQVVKAIEQERKMELFTEGGHRWLDLKRLPGQNNAGVKRIDEVMPGITALKGGTWESTDRLLPIPNSERMLNSNLSQNEGYQ